jgi:hypothetical protein
MAARHRMIADEARSLPKCEDGGGQGTERWFEGPEMAEDAEDKSKGQFFRS